MRSWEKAALDESPDEAYNNKTPIAIGKDAKKNLLSMGIVTLAVTVVCYNRPVEAWRLPRTGKARKKDNASDDER